MFKLVVILPLTIVSLFAVENIKVDSVEMMSISQLEKLAENGQNGYFIEEEEFLKSLVKGKKNKDTNDKVVQHLLENSKVIINTLEKYKEYLEHINNENHIKLSFKDLLLATQYLFENNLTKRNYNILKPILIKESLKYDFIDKDYFSDELNNMSTFKIKEIYKDLKGLI